MREFEGRVAVVTGAASGMGRAFSERFAREGMKVVLADVEEDALEIAVRELRQREHDVTGVLTDVSDPASVEALKEKALVTYGKVHVVCNNAGVFAGGGTGAIWEATAHDWEWVVGVNFWGVVYGVRTFLPLMLAQDEDGHIVNTASIAGLVAGNGIYGVTKHAVVSFSESLHSQLKARGAKVGITVLCPGFVNTRIVDAARNRPARLRNPEGSGTAAPAERLQLMRERIQSGIAPETVADMVLEAIRTDQFYLLTSGDFDDAIRTRMENILQRRNPAVTPPPQ